MLSLFSAGTTNRQRYFQGKHVLITGASSGIGRAIALELASYGSTLSLFARGKDRLESTAADVRASRPLDSKRATKTSQLVLAVTCDCSNHDQVRDAVERVERELGPIDVLINCAGGAQGSKFEDMTAEMASGQMQGNYFSQLYPTQVVFSKLKERGSPGHIVLMSSLAGLTGVYGCSGYCPAKFALRGLAETIYYEMKPYNVDLTIAYPPDTDTPGHHAELLTLPPETVAINGSAGLFTPEQVSESVLNAIVRRQFRVTVGLDGKMLGILTAGMTPGVSVVECLLIPFMRAISAFYVHNFNRIIARHRDARKENKRRE